MGQYYAPKTIFDGKSINFFLHILKTVGLSIALPLPDELNN